jgi:tetratricopeptide (TPR) repeat protein
MRCLPGPATVLLLLSIQIGACGGPEVRHAQPAGPSDSAAAAPADPLLADADRALLRGEWAAAELGYALLLQHDTGLHHARAHRAVARLALGRIQPAVDDALLVLEHHAPPDAQTLAVHVLARAGRCPIALRHGEVLGMESGRPDSAALLAICHVQTGDLVAALDLLAEAPADDPRAWVLRGIIHALEEEPAQAEAAWQRALESDPGQLDALRNLGLLLWSQGQPERARTLLEAYLQRTQASHVDRPRIESMLQEQGASGP